MNGLSTCRHERNVSFSPALASVLRGELERLFDATFAGFTEYLAEMRRQLQTTMPKGPDRSEALRSLVRGLRLTGRIQYPPDFVRWRESQDGLGGDRTDTGRSLEPQRSEHGR